MLLALAALLQLAVGAGLSYLAGFGKVAAALSDFSWPWLFPLAGALAVSFAGYYFAYQGIYRVDGGPELSRQQMAGVVTAGFGGFLAHGGLGLDGHILQAAGADEREAKVRAAGLAGMEHGILAIIGTATAIVVLAAAFHRPTPDFTLPWAVIPVPGLLAAFWAAGRYRDRFRHRRGWLGRLGAFLDSCYLIRQLFVRPLRWGPAVSGMGVFWIADAAAAWAGLAAFGYLMNPASLFVGFATGMVFTRRTGPLGGAGILAFALPVALWYCGAPLAAAVAGIFAYQVLVIWLPMPFALASLPALRELGTGVPGAGGTAAPRGEPGLRQRRATSV